MVLIIDTTDKECIVGLDDGGDFDIKKWHWEKDTGTEALLNIEKLLEKKNRQLQDIGTIFVNQGPGSYTGTRVGITIASTLGWSLNIPVEGFSGKDFRVSKKNHFPTPIYE